MSMKNVQNEVDAVSQGSNISTDPSVTNIRHRHTPYNIWKTLPINFPNANVQEWIVSSTTDWHNSITHDLRKNLVYKFVQSIQLTLIDVTITDECTYNLAAYAKKAEGDAFEEANTKSEYCHLLAKKICELQKKLKKRLQQQNEQTQQAQLVQQAQHQGNTTSAMATATHQSDPIQADIQQPIQPQNVSTNHNIRNKRRSSNSENSNKNNLRTKRAKLDSFS